MTQQVITLFATTIKLKQFTRLLFYPLYLPLLKVLFVNAIHGEVKDNLGDLQQKSSNAHRKVDLFDKLIGMARVAIH
jgi:hypothetical protein